MAEQAYDALYTKRLQSTTSGHPIYAVLAPPRSWESSRRSGPATGPRARTRTRTRRLADPKCEAHRRRAPASIRPVLAGGIRHGGSVLAGGIRHGGSRAGPGGSGRLETACAARGADDRVLITVPVRLGASSR